MFTPFTPSKTPTTDFRKILSSLVPFHCKTFSQRNQSFNKRFPSKSPTNHNLPNKPSTNNVNSSNIPPSFEASVGKDNKSKSSLNKNASRNSSNNKTSSSSSSSQRLIYPHFTAQNLHKFAPAKISNAKTWKRTDLSGQLPIVRATTTAPPLTPSPPPPPHYHHLTTTLPPLPPPPLPLLPHKHFS